MDIIFLKHSRVSVNMHHCCNNFPVVEVGLVLGCDARFQEAILFLFVCCCATPSGAQSFLLALILGIT